MAAHWNLFRGMWTFGYCGILFSHQWLGILYCGFIFLFTGALLGLTQSEDLKLEWGKVTSKRSGKVVQKKQTSLNLHIFLWGNWWIFNGTLSNVSIIQWIKTVHYYFIIKPTLSMYKVCVFLLSGVSSEGGLNGFYWKESSCPPSVLKFQFNLVCRLMQMYYNKLRVSNACVQGLLCLIFCLTFMYNVCEDS